jgi:amino acid adenylation domain-containing protein
MDAPLQSYSDADFVSLLASRQIELRIHEGKLRISAPAGAVDDALKAELGQRKAMLLAYLQNSDEAPLSYAQERLWLLDRFHPGNYAYNIPEPSVIHGAIDRDRMQRAIDTVVQRHSVLRTRFHEDEQGRAVQHIEASVATPLEVVDLRGLPAEEKGSRLKEYLREFARKPFDLRTTPLVRFYLICMEAEKHVVMINIHHIISDQWSMRILRRELLSAYRDLAEGREPALPPLPLQYAEYARREREHADQGIARKLDYWLSQLAGAPEPPQLPFQRTPLVEAPFDGAIHSFTLTEDENAAVRSMGRALRASPYMVLLAAFSALLYRYTGAAEFCIGSPVSERTSTELESVVGLFVNTLVLRCCVREGISFHDLLGQVRETVLDAQANHEVPLQRILTALHASHSQTQGMAQPLFRTMFAFDAFMGGDEDESVSFDPGFAKLDLTLQMYEVRNRMGGWFEYRTDLFAPEEIARFTQAFLLLLRDAIAEPARKVCRLNILPEEERKRLLFERNATEMEFPRERMIHQLFEEQVERTPDAIALIAGEERYSYRELDQKANRVAHQLLGQGVPAESIVGVRIERSVKMVAAMLGILKAGCAYLPLDPHYPEERLQFMTEDSGCSVVLTDAEVDDNPAPEWDENPALAISSSNLAYVIYTSGSTGRPKGVAIEHHSVVSLLHWARGTFPSETLRGTLASTSISFDLSVFEIFVPLAWGHTVILADDLLAFPSLPAAGEVTLMTGVPSAAAALLDSRSIPATLKTIHLAGEAASPSLIDRLYAETSVADVNDLYGPTETTIYSTWTRRSRGGPATIGRPLANTRVYLVDASLELAPDGLPGELLIAGEGVARGYLHRPELTAERFVSPAHLDVEGRAYRTGDLCRYLPDGSLAYLGRLDNQVKVRGYRIELTEVEGVLRSHTSVREAVVVVRTEGAGASLAAAVILQPAQVLDIASLIRHQAKTLPDAMVVKSLYSVEAFPFTANGKVDWKQLQVLLGSKPGETVHAEPQDPLERELVRIWKDGFGISEVGIDDDFFQLGGHSLLALRLFSEIESRLGRRMMLSVLFQAPTIRLLAAYMRGLPAT